MKTTGCWERSKVSKSCMVAMETAVALQLTRWSRVGERMDWWAVSPQRKRTKSSMRGEEGVGRRSERKRRAIRVLEMIRSFLRVRKIDGMQTGC